VSNMSPPRIALVLPTYNEKENLAALVAAIRGLEAGIHTIVVDDNSPDGTGALADELARNGNDVEVIHRPAKLGLGTAYGAGFRAALAEGADLIMTMDADFSHDPSYIPSLLEASRQYDLVIGSRYVPGGGIRNWEAHRKALSWTANTLAHTILGLHARDCTAGFRCYHRPVLETVDLNAIRADGYSYLIEMLYHCERLGFSVGETPIIFTDRKLGQSKISRGEIFKAGGTVLRLAQDRLTGGAVVHRATVALPQEAQQQ
jgi:dolichol-phosphate mannosyltransferase